MLKTFVIGSTAAVLALAAMAPVRAQGKDIVDGGVMVDNARVVKTDIKTSNGVIHVIDTVLLPSEKK